MGRVQLTRSDAMGARRAEIAARYADAFDGLYALQAYKTKLTPVIASVDVICVPTAPTHYKVSEVLADPVVTNSRLGTYTNFVNLLDLCGIAVPTGRQQNGLPMSVTLLAAAGRDAFLAGIARELHGNTSKSMGATFSSKTVTRWRVGVSAASSKRPAGGRFAFFPIRGRACSRPQ